MTMKQSDTLNENLSNQLDEIANEASILNHESPLHLKGNTSVSSSPRPSSPVAFSSAPVSPIPINSIVPLQAESNYIIRFLKCLFKGDDASEESQPLLPIHRPISPPRSPPPNSPPCQSQPPPSYIGYLITFIWDYILTESMREYLQLHRLIVVLIFVITFAIFFIITYATGNLEHVISFSRMILCYIIRKGDDSQALPGICSK